MQEKYIAITLLNRKVDFLACANALGENLFQVTDHSRNSEQGVPQPSQALLPGWWKPTDSFD
jgi:hypothetical protein